MAEEISSHMRRGLLEISILALIEQQPSYGYEIVTRLADSSRLAVSEGTVYPILRRMKSLKWLVTYWEESDSGPPRQYYKLSKPGQKKLQELSNDWMALVDEVNAILGINSPVHQEQNKPRKSS